MIKTLLLFIVTALAEILGCYLPYLWLTQGKSILLLIPAALSLAFLLGYYHCIQQLQDVFMRHMVAFIFALL